MFHGHISSYSQEAFSVILALLPVVWWSETKLYPVQNNSAELPLYITISIKCMYSPYLFGALFGS